MRLLEHTLVEGLATVGDILPIALVIAIFQFAAVRRPPPRLWRILAGLAYIAVGLTLFRVGLSESLIPIGSLMAEQLTAGDGASGATGLLWLALFAASVGFAATLIEPALIAVAERVRTLTGGALHPWSLRAVVALGVAAGLTCGTLRIVFGIPLAYILVPLLALIAALAMLAPRAIVPLALDSGSLATSVVTVPLVAAYGVAVAGALPGRDPLSDGFGLILLALLFPMVSLLAFASLQARGSPAEESGEDDAIQADHRPGG
jgi:hypothetical protein